MAITQNVQYVQFSYSIYGKKERIESGNSINLDHKRQLKPLYNMLFNISCACVHGKGKKHKGYKHI